MVAIAMLAPQPLQKHQDLLAQFGIDPAIRMRKDTAGQLYDDTAGASDSSSGRTNGVPAVSTPRGFPVPVFRGGTDLPCSGTAATSTQPRRNAPPWVRLVGHGEDA